MQQTLSAPARRHFPESLSLGRPTVSSRAVGARWGLMLSRRTVLRLRKKRVSRRTAPGSEEGKGVSAHGPWLRAVSVRKEGRRDARPWLRGRKSADGVSKCEFSEFLPMGWRVSSVFSRASPRAEKIMPDESAVALDPIGISDLSPKLTFRKQTIRAAKREKPSL